MRDKKLPPELQKLMNDEAKKLGYNQYDSFLRERDFKIGFDCCYQVMQAQAAKGFDEVKCGTELEVVEKSALDLANERIARLESEARLHDTIVTQLQRGQKAMTDSLAARIAKLRAALEEIDAMCSRDDTTAWNIASNAIEADDKARGAE